jgi:hypothetical protein
MIKRATYNFSLFRAGAPKKIAIIGATNNYQFGSHLDSSLSNDGVSTTHPSAFECPQTWTA